MSVMNFLKTSFSSTVTEFNKLDRNMQNSLSCNIFKEKFLSFMRSVANSIFKYHNPKGIKLLTRLRLRLSHLHQLKFKLGFQDTLNLICWNSNDFEITIHYLFHCSNYFNERLTLLNRSWSVNSQILKH